MKKAAIDRNVTDREYEERRAFIREDWSYCVGVRAMRAAPINQALPCFTMT